MGEPWCRYLHNVGIIVGCVCFISLTATCLERGLCRVSGFLAGSSFFVYAYHGMPLALAIKVVVRYLPPGSELEVIGLYLGSAISGLKPGDKVVVSDMSSYKNKNKLKLK